MVVVATNMACGMKPSVARGIWLYLDETLRQDSNALISIGIFLDWPRTHVPVLSGNLPGVISTISVYMYFSQIYGGGALFSDTPLF